jgi:hypothetical protein
VGCSPKAFAQEETFGDSTTPLVYNVENTAAKYTASVFLSQWQIRDKALFCGIA